MATSSTPKDSASLSNEFGLQWATSSFQSQYKADITFSFYKLDTFSSFFSFSTKYVPRLIFPINFAPPYMVFTSLVLLKWFLTASSVLFYSKFRREHPSRKAISIKLQTSTFIEIVFRHGCSPVNLLQIFRTAFLKNTSGWLLLNLGIPVYLFPSLLHMVIFGGTDTKALEDKTDFISSKMPPPNLSEIYYNNHLLSPTKMMTLPLILGRKLI